CIHGPVRGAEQLLGRFTRGARHCHSYADRQLRIAVGQGKRFIESGPDTIDDSSCRGAATADAINQYYKLVTAETGQMIARPHTGRQATSHFLQHAVSDNMAMSVVDFLVVIDVD